MFKTAEKKNSYSRVFNRKRKLLFGFMRIRDEHLQKKNREMDRSSRKVDMEGNGGNKMGQENTK